MPRHPRHAPTHRIASHSKPWRHADHEERLDGANGLFLTPTVDPRFGRGFKSLRGRGTVRVRLGRTKREDDTPAIRVEVEDNGPGIAAEVRDRLFQPYVTTHADGKGLGLVFIKYVVEQHGGEVWFEDADPRGARFVFRLPLAAEQTHG